MIAGLDGAGDGFAIQVVDLTQMDFFLWGHFKALIYSSPVDLEEDIIACLVKAAAIRQQLGMFERTRLSLLCHQLCIKVGGHIFEHLL